MNIGQKIKLNMKINRVHNNHDHKSRRYNRESCSREKKEKKGKLSSSSTIQSHHLFSLIGVDRIEIIKQKSKLHKHKSMHI